MPSPMAQQWCVLAVLFLAQGKIEFATFIIKKAKHLTFDLKSSSTKDKMQKRQNFSIAHLFMSFCQMISLVCR